MFALTGLKNDPPANYLLCRAARYLGVPPWELETMPIYWRNLALACETAEGEAEREAAAIARSRARAG